MERRRVRRRRRATRPILTTNARLASSSAGWLANISRPLAAASAEAGERRGAAPAAPAAAAGSAAAAAPDAQLEQRRGCRPAARCRRCARPRAPDRPTRASAIQANDRVIGASAGVGRRSGRTAGFLESSPMHIHILGICGTFMGGLAALAREAGHRVTGCDANVYPPMSDQLRALGIELIEGYDADQLALDARPVRGRQRRHARQPADGSDPRRRRCRTPPARSGWPSTCCRAARCWRSPARTARPRRRRCWPGSSSRPGSRPGFLIGGVPLNFGVSARLGDAGARRS